MALRVSVSSKTMKGRAGALVAPCSLNSLLLCLTQLRVPGVTLGRLLPALAGDSGMGRKRKHQGGPEATRPLLTPSKLQSGPRKAV